MRYSIFSRSACFLLDIQNIGYGKSSAVTRFGPGVRNSYILHYIISGKGYFNGNPVCAGQGFLITPNMREHYYSEPSDPWSFLWIVSDDPAMAEAFELFHADKQTNIFHYNYVDAVKETASFLVKNSGSLLDGFEMLEIFLKILKHQQNVLPVNQEKSNAQVYAETAETYIEANLHRALSVSELTDFLGISQPYLFKIFKERSQKSPKQYILEKKLRKAKQLLTQTDISVTQVANSVGFQDVLSFSKFFRTKTGLSPQQYRLKNNFFIRTKRKPVEP